MRCAWAARRGPTALSRSSFQRVTGEADFPPELAAGLVSGQLLYHCNTTLSYTLRGVHVWLNVAWSFEAGPKQGDRHLARFTGTRASVEVRQGEAEAFRPEVYVVPRNPADRDAVELAVRAALRRDYPDVEVAATAKELRLEVPEHRRVGHESHFAEVTRLFLDYVEDPSRLPAWEESNMCAKYYITTNGVRLAREAIP